MDDITILLEEKRRKVEEYTQKTVELQKLNDKKTFEAKKLKNQAQKLKKDIKELNFIIPKRNNIIESNVLQSVSKLLQLGNSRGVLTYEEIMDALEDENLEPDDIDSIYEMIAINEIDVVDDLNDKN